MVEHSIWSYTRAAWLIVFGMGVLFLDFISKAYVFHLLPYLEPCLGWPCKEIVVFKNFLGIDFSISLAFNHGAAWGLFSQFQVLLLVIRILAIAAMLLYLFFINANPHIQIPLVLIITGAIGNIVDFFLYGYVVDFLHFNLWGYDFPIFNFADTSITIGVFWLFFVASFSKKKSSRKP